MLCGTDSVWDAFDRAAYGPGSFWQVCAALAAPPAVADEPVKPTRKRKVTLAAALGAAKKANANVTGATVEADKVTLQFGEPGASGAPANPWDAVLKPQHRQ